MTDSPLSPDAPATLDQVVGIAVRNDRILSGMTLSELSQKASVSTAMISKIERGQVSASLTTLGALAKGIGVPVINFFAATVQREDVSFVKAGEGVSVQRMGRDFAHSYKLIGRAETQHEGFESFLVTLENPLGSRPVYQHRGAELIYVTEGRMTYRCGETVYEMGQGDALSFNSSVAHGPVELLTDKVSFLASVSKARSREG
jgi:transcriptional regulator with XRE-family HTH domain